jgi:hypothetical protein
MFMMISKSLHTKCRIVFFIDLLGYSIMDRSADCYCPCSALYRHAETYACVKIDGVQHTMVEKVK